MSLSAQLLGLLVIGGGLALVARGHRERSYDPLEGLFATADDAREPAGPARTRRLVAASGLLPLESRLGAALRRFGAGVGITRLERELVLAGVSGRIRADEVLGAQAVGGVAGGVAALVLIASGVFTGRLASMMFVVLIASGVMLPRTTLRRRAARRQLQVHARVSDALDLLTLCLEAGLAFDAALVAVAQAVPGPLGEELSRVVAEMGLGLSRSEALEGLRQRNESSALDSFVVAVLQADALGSPVGRVLAAHAAEARTRRRQEARERAASLPVKILLPTVLLVFPPTFVILLGPAATSIRGAF